jgi:hypothetical protein
MTIFPKLKKIETYARSIIGSRGRSEDEAVRSWSGRVNDCVQSPAPRILDDDGSTGCNLLFRRMRVSVSNALQIAAACIEDGVV